MGRAAKKQGVFVALSGNELSLAHVYEPANGVAIFPLFPLRYRTRGVALQVIVCSFVRSRDVCHTIDSGVTSSNGTSDIACTSNAQRGVKRQDWRD